MIIIELTYKQSLEEVDAYLQEHREFLNKYYTDNTFIASGPKTPRNGGIILSLVSKKQILEIIQEDPFYQHAIADYTITEFEITRFSTKFAEILSS